MNERIKNVRNTLGLTAEAFSARIGITRAAVSNIEKGRSNASNQVIISICREFRVNEEWLRTGEGEMFEEVSQDQEIADFVGSVLADKPDSFRKRLISVLSTLDANDWAVLEKIADELTNNKTDP